MTQTSDDGKIQKYSFRFELFLCRKISFRFERFFLSQNFVSKRLSWSKISFSFALIKFVSNVEGFCVRN